MIHTQPRNSPEHNAAVAVYPRMLTLLLILITMWLGFPAAGAMSASETFNQVCPPGGIQPRGVSFEPGGIIWTTFDRSAVWIYNIDRNSRYPLPDTAPCGSNCHLSRDARWITYLNATDRSFGKMRLDGTERTPLAPYATEVSWWDEETLLVWTPSQQAYLMREGTAEKNPLNVKGVVNIQPGGTWGIRLEHEGDYFLRVFADISPDSGSRETVILGYELPFFNAAAWSPNGSTLAFTAPVSLDGNLSGEIFLIEPGESEPAVLTDLYSAYGSVRINGHDPGELSWSPDGTRLAFWVIPLSGDDPLVDTSPAVLHVLDVQSRQINIYCGFSTTEHTPNPPRLIWSPDGTHLAFGGNIPEDEKGYLLLALDTDSGIFTELSNGIYPALGSPDVIAWGLP